MDKCRRNCRRNNYLTQYKNLALIHKSKENKEQKLAFDGFDCNGKPTGNKCILCIHQNLKCPYQSFFGEGAALICTYDLENCFKDEEKI